MLSPSYISGKGQIYVYSGKKIDFLLVELICYLMIENMNGELDMNSNTHYPKVVGSNLTPAS